MIYNNAIACKDEIGCKIEQPGNGMAETSESLIIRYNVFTVVWLGTIYCILIFVISTDGLEIT